MLRTRPWIPYLYVATGLMLSEVLQATGDSTGAASVFRQAKAVAQGVKLTELLALAMDALATIKRSNTKSQPMRNGLFGTAFYDFNSDVTFVR